MRPPSYLIDEEGSPTTDRDYLRLFRKVARNDNHAYDVTLQDDQNNDMPVIISSSSDLLVNMQEMGVILEEPA